MLNTKIRINCSVDFTYVLWHPFNHIRKMLSAHVIHAVYQPFLLNVLMVILNVHVVYLLTCPYRVVPM